MDHQPDGCFQPVTLPASIFTLFDSPIQTQILTADVSCGRKKCVTNFFLPEGRFPPPDTGSFVTNFFLSFNEKHVQTQSRKKDVSCGARFKAGPKRTWLLLQCGSRRSGGEGGSLRPVLMEDFMVFHAH